MEQRPDRKTQGPEHDAGLNNVRPNDRLDPAKCCVEGGQGGDRGQSENVDPDLLPNIECRSGYHFIAHDKDDGRDVQTRPLTRAR
jgi:hypothetical protein